MFEDLTKDAVQERILSRLPEDDDISPHSPLYIITAPTAEGWAILYSDMEDALKEVFPDTADREYLIRHASVFNISPYPATHAQVEGKFNKEIDIGARFSLGQVNFVVTEYSRYDESYYYILECEQAGEIGNVAPGKIIPIEFIDGLTEAVITKLLIPGEEEEETETFRARFLSAFNNKSFCGNLADYFSELSGIEGVGKFKVLRCMDNNGETKPEWVTIVFTDSQLKKPSEELVEQVQNTFQELENGLPSTNTSGTGLSPIGQLCWVEGVKEEKINFALNLVFEAENSWESLQATIKERLEEFLKNYIQSDWGDTIVTQSAYKPLENHITIRRAEVESLLISIDGIQDSTGIKINDEFSNYEMAWDTIPALGEITVTTETGGSGSGCPYDCPDCTCNHDGSVCERCQGGV